MPQINIYVNEALNVRIRRAARACARTHNGLCKLLVERGLDQVDTGNSAAKLPAKGETNKGAK